MIEQPEHERLLDREHESLRGDALLDAPVDAMAGITPEDLVASIDGDGDTEFS